MHDEGDIVVRRRSTESVDLFVLSAAVEAIRDNVTAAIAENKAELAQNYAAKQTVDVLKDLLDLKVAAVSDEAEVRVQTMLSKAEGDVQTVVADTRTEVASLTKAVTDQLDTMTGLVAAVQKNVTAALDGLLSEAGMLPHATAYPGVSTCVARTITDGAVVSQASRPRGISKPARGFRSGPMVQPARSQRQVPYVSTARPSSLRRALERTGRH